MKTSSSSTTSPPPSFTWNTRRGFAKVAEGGRTMYTHIFYLFSFFYYLFQHMNNVTRRAHSLLVICHVTTIPSHETRDRGVCLTTTTMICNCHHNHSHRHHNVRLVFGSPVSGPDRTWTDQDRKWTRPVRTKDRSPVWSLTIVGPQMTGWDWLRPVFWD